MAGSYIANFCERMLRWNRGRGGFDIVDRLRTSASGPPIHISYYRQDAADAAEEIERLRALVDGLMAGRNR